MARPKLRNPKMHLLIDWLVDPVSNSTTPTLQDWCSQNGVGYSTAAKWKKEPEFRAAWDAKIAEFNQDPSRIQSVIDALWDRAKGGDVQAGKEYREWVNRFQRDAPTETAVSQLTDAELEEAYRDAVLEAAERRGACLTCGHVPPEAEVLEDEAL